MAANDPTTRVDIVDEATWNNILAMGENPLPEAKVADAGKSVVVGDDGKYELGEGGSSGGGVLVVEEDENATLNKTWQEIFDAMLTGGCVFRYLDYVCPVYVNTENLLYIVQIIGGDKYSASHKNDYPSYYDG